MVLTLNIRAIYLDVRHIYAMPVPRTDILGIHMDILVIYTGRLLDNDIINIRQRCTKKQTQE